MKEAFLFAFLTEKKDLFPAGWRPESQMWEVIWLSTGRFLVAAFR